MTSFLISKYRVSPILYCTSMMLLTQLEPGQFSCSVTLQPRQDFIQKEFLDNLRVGGQQNSTMVRGPWPGADRDSWPGEDRWTTDKVPTVPCWLSTANSNTFTIISISKLLFHGHEMEHSRKRSIPWHGEVLCCARINKLCAICLRPLQVNNIFVFIRQVAPVPACWLFKTSATSWPLTFWPWKWCPSHMWRGLPLCMVFLGLSVLKLGPMYVTDRQMSDVRQMHRLMPPPYYCVNQLTTYEHHIMHLT